MPTKCFNSPVGSLPASVKVREGVWQMGGDGWAWSPAARAQVPTLRSLRSLRVPRHKRTQEEVEDMVLIRKAECQVVIPIPG